LGTETKRLKNRHANLSHARSLKRKKNKASTLTKETNEKKD